MCGMAERWDVKSGDGGSIAVWVEGEGPPLVLVHGSVSDHTSFAPLVGELRGEFTIFAMDPRLRRQSRRPQLLCRAGVQ
jgi:pimeloyl-ACP methyl ester carboxylesterase